MSIRLIVAMHCDNVTVTRIWPILIRSNRGISDKSALGDEGFEGAACLGACSTDRFPDAIRKGDILTRSLRTVSYTHLDVYKRQPSARSFQYRTCGTHRRRPVAVACRSARGGPARCADGDARGPNAQPFWNAGIGGFVRRFAAAKRIEGRPHKSRHDRCHEIPLRRRMQPPVA